MVAAPPRISEAALRWFTRSTLMDALEGEDSVSYPPTESS
jgi:hypothetical protein